MPYPLNDSKTLLGIHSLVLQWAMSGEVLSKKERASVDQKAQKLLMGLTMAKFRRRGLREAQEASRKG
jgi:hypothetical protein